MNPILQDVIEKEVLVRASKERVYLAIADPEQIVKWFPDAIEGSLAPGERPLLDFGEYGKSPIFVVAAEPYDYFAYRWLPGGDYMPGFRGDVLTQPNTLVEFRLTDVADGTLVKLTESGFASLPTEFYEGALKDNNGGWDFMLDRLGKYASEA